LIVLESGPESAILLLTTNDVLVFGNGLREPSVEHAEQNQFHNPDVECDRGEPWIFTALAGRHRCLVLPLGAVARFLPRSMTLVQKRRIGNHWQCEHEVLLFDL
jgi:hypothetical protein